MTSLATPSRHSGERRASSLAEIVAAGAGVGVDEAERRLLLGEIDENAGEDRVLEDVGEIAGVKGVAVVHRLGPIGARQRIGATAIDDAWQVWPDTFGQLAKARRSLETQKRTSTSSPLRQVIAMLAALQIGVGGDEGLFEVVGRRRQSLARRLQRVRHDDAVAQRLHRAEIGLRIEARAGSVLEIFVARQPFVGIDAVGQPQRVAGDRDAVSAILRVGAERAVGPQAVNDEAPARADRALVRRLVRRRRRRRSRATRTG